MFKFASKQAWIPRDSALLEDELDESELRGGRGRTRVQAASANVVALELGEALGKAVEVMTGEQLRCKGQNCPAVFSSLSATNGEVWRCEFCGHENAFDLEDEERPRVDTVDYLLAGPSAAAANDDAFTVIFCIDTSGSMCVTEPVAAERRALKGARQANQDVLAFREHGADQRLPNEERGVTYISRLQAVQAACEAQISLLRETKPHVKVGIVTFNSEIQVFDGAHSVVIAGDRLNDRGALHAAGAQATSALKPVSETSEALLKTLYGLEEGGATALGPALAVSIGMLKGAPVGSKVVLCTDGLANTGIGAIEDVPDLSEVEELYRSLATEARDSGAPVSVIAIAGSQCKMEILGEIAEISGGDMDIVEPSKLLSQFANIVAEPVVATSVELMMLTHRLLTIVDPAIEDEATVLTREVGTITASSTASFQYRVRPSAVKEAADLKELPFQVQVRYTKPDGARYLRVVSRHQEVTHEREAAEADVNVGVVAANAMQQAAGYAARGSYERARATIATQKKLMSRRTEAAANSNVDPAFLAENPMYEQEQQQQQEQFANFSFQAQELDDALYQAEVSEAPSADRSASSRRNARSDMLSNAIYRGKKYK